MWHWTTWGSNSLDLKYERHISVMMQSDNWTLIITVELIPPNPPKNPSVGEIVKFRCIKTLFGLYQDFTELQTCSSHYQCGFLFEAFYCFIIITLYYPSLLVISDNLWKEVSTALYEIIWSNGTALSPFLLILWFLKMTFACITPG